jgi:phage tail sheath protein FI
MADHVSPGVYTFEIDLSLYIPILSSSICGVVGVAGRGPIDEPRLTTTWPQYVSLYGDTNPNYMMSYFAREFFAWGSQLWVTRVCEHDEEGNPLATSGYVNHFSNTEYQVSGEVKGDTTQGSVGPYTGTFSKPPIIAGSIIIQDNPSETAVSNESSGAEVEATVDSYSFVLNHVPVVPGTLVVNDDGGSPIEIFTDDGHSVLVGGGTPAGSGTVDYQTGVVVITYGTAPVASGANIRATYSYYSSSTETFTDSTSNPGVLVGSEGGTGTVDYGTGMFSLTFDTAPSAAGPLVAHYHYRTPTDGILQFAALWPGEGSSDISILIMDGSSYLDQSGITILPVSRGGTSFRVIVYDQGQRTPTQFDALSMDPAAMSIQGTSRYVENVIGNKVFGESGFADSVTNNYICARVMKAPLSVDIEELNVFTQLGVDTYEFSLAHTPVVPGTVEITAAGGGLETFYDDIDHPGVLAGTGDPAGTGEINYETGFCRITYGTTPTVDRELLANYNYSSVENPYIGTNGYMLYLDPDRFGVTPMYNYTRVQGTDAIDDLQDGDVIGTFNSALGIRTGLYSFYDADQIDVNLIAAPGFSSGAVASNLITISEYRADSMSIIDPPMGLSVQQVVDWHNGNLMAGVQLGDNTPGDQVGYTTAALNSSYAAMYYSWGKVYDSRNSQYVWVPPSCGAIRAITKNDQVADLGKAPAGFNRGDLPSWVDTEYSPNLGERDYMYGNNNAINPIINVPKLGITIMGERTLYRKPTMLDRIHVRRMLLYMRKVIATAARFLLFEPNDSITWARFRLLVGPYLDFEVARRNLYRYEVICDSSTNTPYMIDTNTMVGNIYLWPEATVERLMINFVVTPTSISFEEAVQLVQGGTTGNQLSSSASSNYQSTLNTTS